MLGEQSGVCYLAILGEQVLKRCAQSVRELPFFWAHAQLCLAQDINTSLTHSILRGSLWPPN